LKAQLNNKIIQATIHFINVTDQISCCCCGTGHLSQHKMLLPAINDQFNLIFLYYSCHKHLLR